MRGSTEAVVVVARRRSWLASRRLSRAPLLTAPSQASLPLPWPPPSLAIDLPELSLFWVPELSLSGGVAPAVQDLEEEVALYREILKDETVLRLKELGKLQIFTAVSMSMSLLIGNHGHGHSAFSQH